MFKKVPLDKFYRLINHGPCVLVTSGKKDKANIAPIAWNMPVNDEPPLAAIAVAETHYTAELIEKEKDFVINVVGKHLLPELLHSGEVSGRKQDKIAKTGFSLIDGIKVVVPHLEKAAGFLECKVISEQKFEGVVLFIGKVLYAAVDEALYDDYWITEKAGIVHHLGGSYFACLGKRFKA